METIFIELMTVPVGLGIVFVILFWMTARHGIERDREIVMMEGKLESKTSKFVFYQSFLIASSLLMAEIFYMYVLYLNGLASESIILFEGKGVLTDLIDAKYLIITLMSIAMLLKGFFGYKFFNKMNFVEAKLGEQNKLLGGMVVGMAFAEFPGIIGLFFGLIAVNGL